MWTLVGGGIKKIEDSARQMSTLLPKKSTWLKTKAVAFDPANNTVTIETGEEVSYHRNGRRCILPTYQKLLLYKCTINSHVP